MNRFNFKDVVLKKQEKNSHFFNLSKFYQSQLRNRYPFILVLSGIRGCILRMVNDMHDLKTLFNLENQVAILTGGAGVLASEMARGLMQAGVRVVLLDINEEQLKIKVKTLRQSGAEVIGIRCDVLDKKNIEEVSTEIRDKFKQIDILINAGGGNMRKATIGVDQHIIRSEN